MVGPIPREERLAASRRLKLGFVCLVGVSAGLSTLQGDPSILVVAFAVIVGLLVGVVVAALAFPRGLELRDRN